ncbi:MAG: hypothetical protein V1782_13885 [Pseudomonadota bacterium]
MGKTQKNKRKWVIYWDWMSDSERRADEIVAIFDSRYSADKVSFLMNIIYKQSHLSLHEMVEVDRNQYNPEIQYDGRLTCGRNPVLTGEIAEIISFHEEIDSGLETIIWKPHYIATPYHNQEGEISVTRIYPPERETTRLITGPISYECVWDRTKGQIKNKFQVRKEKKG